MESISADEIVEAARDWDPLIEAADRALVALATGTARSPLRTSLPLGTGSLLTMPGMLEGSGTASVKLVSVVPDNPQRGLPTVQALAVIFDATTGEPRAVVDGTALTLVRTAAVTAAAVGRLAPQSASRLAMIGAGAQALWHVRAICSVRPIEHVSIWSPSASKDRLAARLSAEMNPRIVAAGNLEEAVAEVDIVCCATTSTSALVDACMPAHRPVSIAAIGAFRPDMAEVGASAFREAGRVYVDDVGAVLQEAGDVLDALAQGAIREREVVPVGAARRQENEPLTIFKSVGSAAEDAAVAETLLRRLRSG